MYRWIWERMPFGRAGKLAGMAMLALGIAGLLWFVIFPAVDPLLPFNDVQVTSPSDGPTPVIVPPTVGPLPSGQPR